MRIGRIMGRVTLSRQHASLPAGRLLLAGPAPLDALQNRSDRLGEELVLYDALGAGRGALVGFSEGREAANPFHPRKAPVDAFCACLLDQVVLDESIRFEK